MEHDLGRRPGRAGVVSRSSRSLEKMMAIVVRVAGRFGLLVSEPRTEIACLLPKGMEEYRFEVNAAGQVCIQTNRQVQVCVPRADCLRGREAG